MMARLHRRFNETFGRELTPTTCDGRLPNSVVQNWSRTRPSASTRVNRTSYSAIVGESKHRPIIITEPAPTRNLTNPHSQTCLQLTFCDPPFLLNYPLTPESLGRRFTYTFYQSNKDQIYLQNCIFNGIVRVPDERGGTLYIHTIGNSGFYSNTLRGQEMTPTSGMIHTEILQPIPMHILMPEHLCM